MAYQKKERQILIYTTKEDEKLYIQYPGKETVSTPPRPWDFRPKLLKSDGTYLKDLEFRDIWDTLAESFVVHPNKDSLLRLLAMEFYRIAFMIGYKTLDIDSEYLVRDLNVLRSKTLGNKQKKFKQKLYFYEPMQESIDMLSKLMPNTLGISWESFLVYNDLLAFNEDCKYFYIGETKPVGGLTYIGQGAGRTNTMLSHINIIGFVLGETKFSEILQQIGRNGGVFPATNKNIIKILGKYLE